MKCFLLFSALLLAAPAAHGQWVQTNGPEGGSVTSIANDDSFIYIGTWGGGIFRSSDDGQNWVPINSGLDPNTDVEALEFLDGKLYAELQSGAIVSSDLGATWEGSTSLLATAFQFGKYFLSGAYRSSNGGVSWIEDSTIDSLNVYSFATMGPDLFAATNGGVLRSTDSGATWEAMNSGLTSLQAQRVFADGGNLFVGLYTIGVFRSTDTGATWIPSNQGLPGDANINSFTSQGSNIYAEANDGWVFLSTNSGNSWEIKDSLLQEGVSALEIIHGKLFAGSGRGVMISTDSGDSWSLSNKGIIATQISAMAQIGTCVFVGTNSSGVFRSTNSGMNWLAASNAITAYGINALTTLGTELFAATGDGVFYSNDSGASWIRADSGLPLYEPDIYSLTAKDSILYAGTSDSGVYSSSNGGANWVPANGNLSTAWVLGLSALGNNLFASLPNNQSGCLARSTNNGITWNYAASGFQYQQVNSLAANGPDFFAASFGPGIFKSTDSGSDWVASGNGVPNGMIPNALLSFDGNLFLAGAPYGVYSSTDDGNSWGSVGTGIPLNMVLTTLLSDSTDLFVGTQGTGVWRRPLSEMINTSAVGTKAPLQSTVSTYPNPFTQSTTISLTTTESVAGEVSIYNLLGTEVARMFEGELSAGEHTFTWNAANMPPGAYWAAVRMNGSMQQIPIVLQP